MYGYGGSGAGLLGLLAWLIIFTDLILLGVWLWQHISKK